MTIAERNKKLKHFITCLKCEVSGKPCDDNCPTQYEAGNMGEIIENLEAISKLLEQEPETVTEFADHCRECGAEYGKLLKQTRWIPFYESEPDVGEEVLVCDVDQGIYLTWKTRYGMYFDAWGDEIKSIVAWMSLPEPYKAESEG